MMGESSNSRLAGLDDISERSDEEAVSARKSKYREIPDLLMSEAAERKHQQMPEYVPVNIRNTSREDRESADHRMGGEA